MKKDITHARHIQQLIQAFYEKVKADELLGTVFDEVAHTNWDKHIPMMCRFWENVLLYESNYEGNPVELHKHLHKVMPLSTEHFRQWNLLFIQTVDELFSGDTALRAKQHALKISAVLQSSILSADPSAAELRR
jgi:hemoglobin